MGRAQARAAAGGPRLAPSTITGILRRAGWLNPAAAPGQHVWQRFEHIAPNTLWQMDFKGYFALLDQRRCHPLTVLDDHSRFALLVRACAGQRDATVQQALTGVFRRYGLPTAMLIDNGSPTPRVGCARQRAFLVSRSPWLVAGTYDVLNLSVG